METFKNIESNIYIIQFKNKIIRHIIIFHFVIFLYFFLDHGFKIPERIKITSQAPKKNWEHIAMTQKNTIKNLRNEVKVINQKNKQYASTIQKLKVGVMYTFNVNTM